MKNKLFALVVVAPLLFGAVACGGWFGVDGSYHARWVARPAYEGHPRYRWGNYTVYEVNGEYYREHEGRWIVYRERPRELVVWQ
jgi:hypothetical protein